ncbi:MAG: hypothetical protein EXS47_00005 [Candidatus Zambryskibacteria bacterium]|nr:hypothetical protein [Candidatus Zambryskibacteria bacterium]
MKEEITYPCVYAICAGMPCGPILIPEEHKVSDEAVNKYVLMLMKMYIKSRAVIRWDEKGIKKATEFWRDINGGPCYQK